MHYHSNVWNQKLLHSSPAGRELEPSWIELLCPTHPTDAQLDRDLGNLKARATPSTLRHVPQTIPEQCVQCGSEHYPAERATSTREHHCHEAVYLVCINVKVGGMCQIYIHVNGQTQGFPAEHCPEHHTPSTGLSSSHSASWCHHLQDQGARIQGCPHDEQDSSDQTAFFHGSKSQFRCSCAHLQVLSPVDRGHHRHFNWSQ